VKLTRRAPNANAMSGIAVTTPASANTMVWQDPPPPLEERACPPLLQPIVSVETPISEHPGSPQREAGRDPDDLAEEIHGEKQDTSRGDPRCASDNIHDQGRGEPEG
jgi:hypothetical protein